MMFKFIGSLCKNVLISAFYDDSECVKYDGSLQKSNTTNSLITNKNFKIDEVKQIFTQTTSGFVEVKCQHLERT